ncbi:MAG: transcription antitermination factor NusB [Candidatus Rokubacteria bacterium]|nr:transcription antitermination factor NusB [Candidatus Rokubacteria bacterium]
MGRRRKSRELALQLLYQLDVSSESDPVPSFEEFWSRHPVSTETKEFAELLVRETKANQTKIDELIIHYADNWELSRMAVVDRNILREGIYELLWLPEIPPKVVINEALEIAKKYSTEQSTRFLNGILDRVQKEMVKP